MIRTLFDRNFTLLLLGQVSSLTGNYTLKFALSMYVLEQTGSASVFAGLLSAAMLPTVLLSPFGGVLADRFDRRRIMVALDALSCLAVLAAALALPHGQDVFVIGALLIVLSVLAAFESPTVQACVPQLLAGDALIRGNAAVSQVSALAGLLTPFCGAALYAALGLMPILYGAAGCFGLTALLECFIRFTAQRPQPAAGFGRRLRDDFAESARFLLRDRPAVLRLLGLAALASLFMAGVVVVGFPYLVRTVLGLPAELYGAAESAAGAAALLGCLCVGSLVNRLRPRCLAAIFAVLGLCLCLAGGAFLLPLGALGRYAVLLAAFCCCQFGCCVFSTYAVCLIQQRTPAQLMGRVMAYVYTISLCAQPLGQLVYGGLFDHFADSVYRVLLPSGLLLGLLGVCSARFFAGFEEEEN